MSRTEVLDGLWGGGVFAGRTERRRVKNSPGSAESNLRSFIKHAPGEKNAARRTTGRFRALKSEPYVVTGHRKGKTKKKETFFFFPPQRHRAFNFNFFLLPLVRTLVRASPPTPFWFITRRPVWVRIPFGDSRTSLNHNYR